MIAALAFSMVPAVALAQEENDEFSRYMLEGVRYFKDGQSNPENYRKAIKSFEAAQKINDIPDISYNIGRCHHMLGNCQEALKFYQSYAAVSEANADVVKKYMDALNKECTTGNLTVICSSAPAKVRIDALPSLLCGDETQHIALSPGEHIVVVSADGIAPQTQTVTVTSQKDSVVSFTLATPAKAETSAVAAEHVPSIDEAAAKPASLTNHPELSVDATSNAPSKWFWAGVGTAGAGTLLAIIGGAVLANAHDDFTFASGKNGLATFYERDKGKYVGGQVVLGIGATAAIAGITLIVLDRFVFDEKDSTTAQVAPVLSVSPDLASAGIAVSF